MITNIIKYEVATIHQEDTRYFTAEEKEKAEQYFNDFKNGPAVLWEYPDNEEDNCVKFKEK